MQLVKSYLISAYVMSSKITCFQHITHIHTNILSKRANKTKHETRRCYFRLKKIEKKEILNEEDEVKELKRNII